MGAMVEIVSPLTGTVARVERAVGAAVDAGTTVVVVESMKMEYAVDAAVPGTVTDVRVAAGDAVQAGDVLVVVSAPAASAGTAEPVHAAEPADTDEPVPTGDPLASDRDDLAEVLARHAVGLDTARPEVVARRHERGHRTARENVADLVDPGSFVEYGPLAIAA